VKKIFFIFVLMVASFSLTAGEVIFFNGTFIEQAFGYPSTAKGEPVAAERKVSDKALRISLPPASWAGFVLAVPETDISGMRKNGTVDFWIKGNTGNEKNLSVMLIDSIEDKEPFHTQVFLSDYLTMSKEWQYVIIPLADFLDDGFYWSMEKNARVNGKMDWGKIQSLSFDISPSETTETVIFVDGVKISEQGGTTKIVDKYAEFEKKYAYEGEYKSPIIKGNKNFKWPKKIKAAVSLTHDDAYQSCITNALPLLEKYKLHGTFFMSGFNWYQPANIEGWKEVFEAGNEIGNHTTYHPCDRAMGFMQNGFASQDYTLGRIAAEIESVSNEMGKYGFRPSRGYSFAYPCGQTTVGENKKSYIPVIEKNFIAARTVEYGTADPKTVQLSQVPAYSGAEMTIEKMIGIIKEAEDTGGWVVLYFHGIGADSMPVDIKKYEALLKYLADNKETIWTGTFGEVAEQIVKSRGKK